MDAPGARESMMLSRRAGAFLLPLFPNVAAAAIEIFANPRDDPETLLDRLSAGLPAADLTKDVDSVTFCLSKGLSAPVGPVLCGSTDFIYEARRARKLVGGGMRQPGVIAAAGIVALDEMVDRLADDHATARRLAQGLADLPGLEIDPDTVETDIVIFELARDDITPAELSATLREKGVLLSPIGGRRLVTVNRQPL